MIMMIQYTDNIDDLMIHMNYTNDTDDIDVNDDIGNDGDNDDNNDKRKKLIKHSKKNSEVKIIMER